MDVFEKVKYERPVIHILTNYVTARDVVNMVLAVGAAGICADEPQEAADITSISKGLLINIGTPSDRKVETFLASGKKANELGIPVVLDPVGIGASPYRQKFMKELLEEVHFTCIRGNMSEIATIAKLTGVLPGYGKGAARAFRWKKIDAEENEAKKKRAQYHNDVNHNESSAAREINLQMPVSQGVETSGEIVPVEILQRLAAELDTVIAVTGVRDYIVDAGRVWTSDAGTQLQRRVTGSGCMLSGFLTAVLAAAEDYGEAAYQAIDRFGKAAEEAEEEMRASGHIGTGSFVTYLIDAVSRIPGL